MQKFIERFVIFLINFHVLDHIFAASTIFFKLVYLFRNSKITWLNFVFIGPDIPLCNSSIVSNKTTTSIVLDLRNLETTGAERYYAEIFENESESNERKHFNISNNSFEHITNLTQGTAYTLQIFAVSEHNIRSADSCQVKSVYTCKLWLLIE